MDVCIILGSKSDLPVANKCVSPGRIVGQTHDTNEKKAFTLTLSTREQHIRRHRATSNICSNETLIALMGAMHMSLLGPDGITVLAKRVAASTEATKKALSSIEGVELLYPNSSNFREFVIKIPWGCSILEFG